MPSCCCVPGCNGRGGFKFPQDEDLRKLWLVAICRKDNFIPSKHSVVCGRHFTEEQFSKVSYYGTPYLQRILLKNTVPCKFPWTLGPSPSSPARQHRLITKTPSNSRPKPEKTSIIPDLPTVLYIANPGITEGPIEVIAACEETQSPKRPELDEEVGASKEASYVSRSTQTMYCTNYSAHQFRNDPKGMVHFTGLETYNKFLYVLDTLGSGSNKLKYRYFQVEGMSVQDQFFLTLIKLRRHTPDIELGYNFGVSSHFVSNVWVTWVNFMYMQWGELGMWPDTDLVEYVLMPGKFQNQRAVPSDEKIAGVRSNREIVNGVERAFKILGEPMSVTEGKLATRIVNVCFMLHNFRSAVIGENDVYE